LFLVTNSLEDPDSQLQSLLQICREPLDTSFALTFVSVYQNRCTASRGQLHNRSPATPACSGHILPHNGSPLNEYEP
jgi:hypothetical protein